MLYTRRGDGGTSTLFGQSGRLPKDSPIYDALGSLDELNSLLGLCRARAKEVRGAIDVPKELLTVQQTLFIAQAECAGAQQHVTQAHVDALEASIAEIEKVIEAPHGFVIAGINELSGSLDFARAVSRRAERAVVHASSEHPVSAELRAYLNRLSSLLYALARYAAKGEDELSPDYR
jgi:cob(I)alamin adenosyltransferase